METVLTTMPSQVNICICDIDWVSYFKSCTTKVANSVLLRSMRKELKTENQTDEGELLSNILNAKSVEKQQEITLAFIVQWLAKWIGGNSEEVDCNVPFFTYGIDSIGASIFKLYIFQNLNIEFEVRILLVVKLLEILVDPAEPKEVRKTLNTHFATVMTSRLLINANLSIHKIVEYQQNI